MSMIIVRREEGDLQLTVVEVNIIGDDHDRALHPQFRRRPVVRTQGRSLIDTRKNQGSSINTISQVVAPGPIPETNREDCLCGAGGVLVPRTQSLGAGPLPRIFDLVSNSNTHAARTRNTNDQCRVVVVGLWTCGCHCLAPLPVR